MRYAQGKAVLTASKTTIYMSYVSFKNFETNTGRRDQVENLSMEAERHPGQDERHGTNIVTEAPVLGRPAVVFLTWAGVLDVRGCLGGRGGLLRMVGPVIPHIRTGT